MGRGPAHRRYDAEMPLYKEQGIVLRSVKLGEADKIVTVMTQGSGKIRGVAKGIRKTTSRFGARLEPFTHVSLLCYRSRGALDTITQAEIVAPHISIRGDLALIAAGETMLEAVDKVAEEHEKNVRLTLLLLAGMRALDARPADPSAVAESFLLKLLALSGFHPSLTACANCGRADPELFDAGQGGAVCASCAEPGAGYASTTALGYLAELGTSDLERACLVVALGERTSREARNLLYGFTEYHLERRMKSFPMLVRTAT